MWGIIIIMIGTIGIAYFMINEISQRIKINNEGIETDAIVTNIDVRIDSENKSRTYCIEVSYTDDIGNQHNGHFMGDESITIGNCIKIKYLPNNYDRVVPINNHDLK